jgi:hypothetical protein
MELEENVKIALLLTLHSQKLYTSIFMLTFPGDKDLELSSPGHHV